MSKDTAADLDAGEMTTWMIKDGEFIVTKRAKWEENGDICPTVGH